MRIEVSDYYKEKGFNKASLQNCKDGRKRISLFNKNNSTTKFMQYAKYLYTSHNHCDIPDGDTIDHINGDKTDDRLENLQVISKSYNSSKDHEKKTYEIRICETCGKEFLFETRNANTHAGRFCSKECYRKSPIHFKKGKIVHGICNNKKIDKLNLEEIQKDIAAKMLQPEIAKKYNVSRETIKRFIHSHGIYMGGRKPSRKKHKAGPII